jgi:hypothetical protein
VGVGQTFPVSRVYTRYVPRKRLRLTEIFSGRTIRSKGPSEACVAGGGSGVAIARVSAQIGRWPVFLNRK